MSAISTRARQELIHAISERYRAGSKARKQHILDEFVALTTYHRKHAIRILGASPSSVVEAKRPRSRVYDEAVRQALVVLWEASDRVCGKRLKPLLPVLLPALERHGHLHLDAGVRARLLEASAATIDRLLAGPRAVARGRRSRARAKPAIRKNVPVRTFADWNDPMPGYVEADLVAHCGESVAGSFSYTLVLTDIASAWTECIALLVREGTLIVDAVERMRTAMPFALRGIDTDNGSEFVNEALLTYCTQHNIEFTRSRPYHKNDQAWVEQKNGSIVRRLVGYGRLSGAEATRALAQLYAASRLYVNFFQPSFKLKSKTRDGARVKKVYYAPATPCERLLAHKELKAATKKKLREQFKSLDPVLLLQEIRRAQQTLSDIAANGPRTPAAPSKGSDAELFLASLSSAWKDGEARPTHRKRAAATHWWRSRVDPFADAWPVVEGWLIGEPSVSARVLMDRLATMIPDAYASKAQLRTLQRRVKAWRSERAKELVLGGLREAAVELVET